LPETTSLPGRWNAKQAAAPKRRRGRRWRLPSSIALCTDALATAHPSRWTHDRKRLAGCPYTWGRVRCPLSGNCLLRADSPDKTDTPHRRTDSRGATDRERKSPRTPIWARTPAWSNCPSIRYFKCLTMTVSKPDAPLLPMCCKSANRWK
jgi:hypothetical protein